jgi:hypothetical protein
VEGKASRPPELVAKDIKKRRDERSEGAKRGSEAIGPLFFSLGRGKRNLKREERARAANLEFDLAFFVRL